MTAEDQLDVFVPDVFRTLEDPARDLPRLAKDTAAMATLEAAMRRVPTRHEVLLGDAHHARFPSGSVHLVLTSPPYWTLKEYRRSEGQLGWIEDYGEFLDHLDDVWRICHKALIPGGRLICVVGDVCLSRRKNSGRHTVVPLHASIQERCRKLGFDNLAPIIWSKIANAAYEVDRGAGGFLGKPYEPNAVVKNDIGTASTQVAAAACGRNSLGIEVDPVYMEAALNRLRNETGDLLKEVQINAGEIPGNAGFRKEKAVTEKSHAAD